MAFSQPILQPSIFTPDKRACCGRSDVHMAPRLHRPEIARSPCNKAQRCLNLTLASAAVGEQTTHVPSWGPTTEVWTAHTKSDYDDLQQRFRAADLDGNGVIDREELRALLESTDSGSQYSITHWLEDNDLDRIMKNYDANEDGVIQFEEFCKLAQDNILFKGKIEEYEAAFKLVDTENRGSIGAGQLAQLFQNLGNPLPYDRLVKIMSEYDVGKKGEINFGEMMNMFRDDLLDLNAILDYIKMPPVDESTSSTSSMEFTKVQHGGILDVESEEELDKMLADDPTSLTVLLASLTWCRPCKTLAKPLQQLAAHYREAAFLRTYGNVSEAAKHLFKDRLMARVTPTFYFFRNGELVHTHTGANKSKLEYLLRQHLKARERPQQELFPVQATAAGYK